MSNFDEKKSKMNPPGASSAKNWWESQGFAFSIIMVFGSMWGLSEDTATSVVSAVTGLIGAVMLALQFFKTSKFKGWKQVLSDGNTLQYLVAAVAVFIPNASALFPSLQGLVDAFLSKNIGAIISALVSVGVALYNIFLKGNANAARHVAMFLALLFCTQVVSAQIEQRLIDVTVTSVFDGDGCNVIFPDRTRVDRLRFIGIDAPERRGYSLKTQPYGDIAGDTLREAINKKKILVDTSATKGSSRDEYGRLLVNAYTIDTVNLQFMMVEKGLAWAVQTPKLKEPKLNDVLALEMKLAKQEERGLWKSYITKEGKKARIFKPSTWRKNYSIKKE